MNGTLLKNRAQQFNQTLELLKKGIDPDFPWYPYQTLGNFHHLEAVFNEWDLASLAIGRNIADIGAADGDMAFFLESLGYSVDVIDYPPTNYNSLRGVVKLKEQLGSAVNVHNINLDAQFQLPETRYDLIFFLGILYHLKNPYYALEKLAGTVTHLIVSTRIARFAPDGTPLQKIPVAYLVSPTETNNDSTNYWIFSETGLKRLFDRSGWEVMHYHTSGDIERSNPADNDRDERAFVLLRSRVA